jgi:hypothetical protein
MTKLESRPEIILAALLYLITAYHRNPCPRLAACIARHLHYIACHPDADQVIADVAAASISEWEDTSHGPSMTVTRRATFLGLPLH